MVLSMCNLQKRLIRPAFWVLLEVMFSERLNKNGTAINITRETTNNQQKNIIRWNIYKKKISFTKTSIKVSLRKLSLQEFHFVHASSHITERRL